MEAETCRRELAIEIPAEEVQREAESVTAQFARVARIPGFRPGRAPATLVRRHFRDDIRSEVVQSLLPRFFESAVKSQKWSVVGRPRFEDLKFEDDRPLTCKATFEVFPEVQLGDYRELEVEEESPTVSDPDIEKALEELRQRAATFEVVEGRPAAEDDYVIANYQGRDVNDPESRPLEAREALVRVGGKGTVATFSENLKGAKPGETREFDVTYREDYPQKMLAGKTFHYRVEAQSIKKRVVPPVDDELAKSVSEISTLAELRVKLREDLQERRKREVEATAKQKLIEKLLAVHKFPVPEALVEAQLDRKLERVLTQLIAQGIDPRATEIDWRKVRADSRPEAEKEVQASLVLEKVAITENLQVSEEELDDIIRELAAERREPPATLKTRLTRDGEVARLESTRRTQKALDFIYRNAKIIRKNEPDPAPARG